MLHRHPLAFLPVALALLAPLPAGAQERADGPFDSVVVGLLAHEIASEEEGGVDGTLELRFRPLFGRDWPVEILPTIGGTLTLGDGTDAAYAGATARYHLTGALFVEAFFGLTVHDADTPRDADGLDLGCTLLFREGAGIGYRLGSHAVSLAVTHASHGDILCDGENDGMTSAGVRYGYHF